MKIAAEYIWYNSVNGFLSISKTLFVDTPETKENFNILNELMNINLYKDLYVDDLVLHPVSVRLDPFRKSTNVIVLCEDAQDKDSYRKQLENIMNDNKSDEVLYEYSYEFSLSSNTSESVISDASQNKYFNTVIGIPRKEAEHAYHTGLECGLALNSFTRGAKPEQWNITFGQSIDIRIADDVMFFRYILERICEVHKKQVSYDSTCKNTILLSHGKMRNKEIDCSNIAQEIIDSKLPKFVVGRNSENIVVLKNNDTLSESCPYMTLLSLLQ